MEDRGSYAGVDALIGSRCAGRPGEADEFATSATKSVTDNREKGGEKTNNHSQNHDISIAQ